MWVCVLCAADCKVTAAESGFKVLMLVLRYWYSNTGGKTDAVGAPGETFRGSIWGRMEEVRMGSYVK